MPGTVRQLLHCSAARVLTGYGEHPQQVAEHWWEWAQPREAAVWSKRAAQAVGALRLQEADECDRSAAEAVEAAAELNAVRRIAARPPSAHSLH